MSNAASGVAVSPECKVSFEKVRTRKLRYVIFVIDEAEGCVKVEQEGPVEETYDDFSAKLSEEQCRYCIFDYDYKTDDDCQMSKIICISWAPDNAKIKSKMLYATSSVKFQKELGEGLQYSIQCTDDHELQEKNIQELCVGKKQS